MIILTHQLLQSIFLNLFYFMGGNARRGENAKPL